MNWVSTQDKKPESDKWVLYHAPGIFPTGPQTWIGKYNEDDNEFVSNAGWFGGNEVTHWCYLELPE
jgi:hypothetical protein